MRSGVMSGNGFVEVTREESDAASLRFGCGVFEDGRTGQRLLPAEVAARLRSGASQAPPRR